MANIYSLKSGLASDTTVWSSGTVPVSGDRVLISAGHTVTLDGAYEWGDDSTASIVINTITTVNSITIHGTGILKASRTVSSSLTCNGGLYLSASGTTCGTYDAGTAADPIPLGINHTILLNKSAAMLSGKYGFDMGSGTTYQGKIWMHGHYRRRNAVVTSGALTVGETTCDIDDATGWQVGDSILFAVTSTSVNGYDERTILTITAGAGTTATVTFAALTYAHAANCPVGNFTSNILVKPYQVQYASFIACLSGFTSGSFNGALHFENVRFEGSGGNAGSTSTRFGILNITPTTTTVIGTPYDPVNSCCFYASGTASANGGNQLNFSSTRQKVKFNDTAFVSLVANVSPITENQASSAEFNDAVVYRCPSIAIQTSYSQGGLSFAHNRFKFFGVGGYAFSGNCFDPTFTDCVFGYIGNVWFLVPTNIANGTFTRCDFGYTFSRGAATYLTAWGNTPNSGLLTFIDCMFASGLETRPAGFRLSQPSTRQVIINKNADVTAQELHTPPGTFYRDNAVSYRSKSAIRLNPETATTSWTPYAASYTVSVPAPNGIPQTIVGYLRKNSSYGSSTLPHVEIAGLGITPVVFTMSNTADTWEQFSLTVTNTSGADGNLTLTFYGQSSNAGAACWLDGIYSAPFVTAYRHYGYVFDTSQVARTVDPVSVLSESAAGALTGLAIDYGTQTLTISGSRTLSEIYDFCHASLVSTANLSQPEFFTSGDGVNFTCSFNVVLSGAITGSGALSMPANTLTVTGTSSVNITHDSGVFTAITVTGYTAGARIQIYDSTASAELYNDTPVGSSVVLNTNWTTNHTIRVRMSRLGDLPTQSTGILSSAGASFLLSPVTDSVYVSNGIDGSTVTEFAADYPNVQIDVNDLDGSTSPQRIYAWFQHNLTTAQGIANYFGGLTADDSENYKIDVSAMNMTIQNVGAMSVLLTGARLYRNDNTTIFAVGTAPIQADPSKAYVATGAGQVVNANVVQMNSADVIGTGTKGDDWRGVGVPPSVV